jgi:indolepyruvate ferredoxin oxidoreductase
MRPNGNRIDDYETLIVSRVIPELTDGNHVLAVEIAGLPLAIRGFGHVKTASEEQASARLAILLDRWPGDTHAQIAAE